MKTTRANDYCMLIENRNYISKWPIGQKLYANHLIAKRCSLRWGTKHQTLATVTTIAINIHLRGDYS